MFDLKKYDKYKAEEFDGRKPLKIATYNLNLWGRYENNIATLSPFQKGIAKRIFKGLKQLEADERAFLAEKYRMQYKGTDQRVSDKILAKKYNLSVLEYRKIRNALEYKFFHLIKDDLTTYEEVTTIEDDDEILPSWLIKHK